MYSSNGIKNFFSNNSFFVFGFLAFVLSFSTNNFAAKGNLDRTFGDGGKMISYVGGAEKSHAATVQADGKVVAVGGISATGANFDFLIQRYNTDGTPDAGFGTNGRVVLPISANSEVAFAVTMQSDGKIVAGGYTQMNSGYADYCVVRLLPDGQPDQSFGTAGVKVFSPTQTSDNIRDLAIQTIGGVEKIIVGGYVNTAPAQFSVARLNPNGELDATFGDAGIKSVSVGGNTDILGGIAIDGANRIVAVGSSRFDFGGGSYRDDFAVVRFTPDGALDPSFSGDGKQITQMTGSASARSVVIQNIGGEERIVAGGIAYRGSANDFALARFKPDGTLDTTFGTSGRTFMSFTNFTNLDDQIHKLLIQSDQKIVAVGFTAYGANQDFALARFDQSGALDKTFGSCGKIITDLGSNTDIAYGAALQNDGKIIAVGESGGVTRPTSADFSVVRYTKGGQATATSGDFDGDGKEDVSVYRPSDGVWYMNCSCQGSIAVKFGLANDIPQAGDYDGDGRTDQAVYRGGVWYIARSSDAHVSIVQFGLAGDVPTVGDYDGDEKADISVWRPSTGAWYVLRSSDNQFTATSFGLNGDKPVAADYDGDGKTDLAIYRNGDWWVKKSSEASGNFSVTHFGIETDTPLTGDFDGDGRSDYSVYRASEGAWYQQTAASIKITRWGIAADKPVGADYDGDGKSDIAVFRDGAWYILNANNTYSVVNYGLRGDIPVVVH